MTRQEVRREYLLYATITGSHRLLNIHSESDHRGNAPMDRSQYGLQRGSATSYRRETGSGCPGIRLHPRTRNKSGRGTARFL